jgi:hypothetical protein
MMQVEPAEGRSVAFVFVTTVAPRRSLYIHVAAPANERQGQAMRAGFRKKRI